MKTSISNPQNKKPKNGEKNKANPVLSCNGRRHAAVRPYIGSDMRVLRPTCAPRTWGPGCTWQYT